MDLLKPTIRVTSYLPFVMNEGSLLPVCCGGEGAWLGEWLGEWLGTWLKLLGCGYRYYGHGLGAVCDSIRCVFNRVISMRISSGSDVS